MMYTDIEFICKGNNGRSPIGQAAARKVATYLGYGDKLQISSSGSMADLSQVKDLKDMMRSFVPKAIEAGTIPAERAEMYERDHWSVVNELVGIEEAWRNQFIWDNYGIDYRGHVRRQTVVRPEAQLILPVDESVLNDVNKLYESVQGPKPRIVALPAFAALDLKLDHYKTLDYNGYEALANDVAKAASTAIRRVIRD